MNRAAVYSREVLDRFDTSEEQALQLEAVAAAAQRRVPELQPGRVVSGQPFGAARGPNSMGDRGGDRLDSLVRVKREAMAGGGQMTEEGQAHFPSPNAIQRTPSLFAASSVNVPGDDAARQIATMQAKLQQRLGPEYISTRQGPSGGGKLSYLEGWKAIDLANEVFGFNGWSSTLVRLDVDFVDETEGKRFNVGVSAVMRITLRDGTHHEDVGYGHCENVKMKYQAMEKARKEATTDALKRALRTFGRMLGNCLYDKKFIETASRMKPVAPDFDVGSLKRSSIENTAPSPHAQPQPPQQPQQQQQQNQPPLQQQAPLHQTTAPETRGSNDARSTSTDDSAAAPNRETLPPSGPSTHQSHAETRLREERRAVAAAKQAALRRRQREEEQRASLAGAPVQGAAGAASRGVLGQEGLLVDAQRAPLDGCMREEDGEILDGETDELDEMLVQKARRPLLSKPVRGGALDDSGIALVDDGGPSSSPTGEKMPLGEGKGRFLNLNSPSHPVREERGKQQAEAVSAKRLDPPKHQSSSPWNQQRSKQYAETLTSRPTIPHSAKRSPAMQSNEYQQTVKKPRPSPYRS